MQATNCTFVKATKAQYACVCLYSEILLWIYSATKNLSDCVSVCTGSGKDMTDRDLRDYGKKSLFFAMQATFYILINYNRLH